MKRTTKSASMRCLLLACALFSPVWLIHQTAVAGDLAASRYVDPKGFFKIVPPAGWKIQEYPQDVRGKVAFNAPVANIDLRVLVNAVEFSTTDALVTFCKSVESRTGLSTHIERVEFSGKAAVTRWYEAKGVKCFMIDFLEGQVDHNLQYCAPRDQYEKYLPVAQKSMDTYEATSKGVSADMVKEHVLAKKRRLAQLMLDQGSTDAALEYVKEGLEVSAKDPELLRLKEEIEKRKAK